MSKDCSLDVVINFKNGRESSASDTINTGSTQLAFGIWKVILSQSIHQGVTVTCIYRR